MSFIGEWAKKIWDFGGALKSEVGMSMDIARVHTEDVDEDVFGKTLTSAVRTGGEGIAKAAGGLMNTVEVPYSYATRGFNTLTGAARIARRNLYADEAAGKTDNFFTNTVDEWNHFFAPSTWYQAYDDAKGTSAMEGTANLTLSSYFSPTRQSNVELTNAQLQKKYEKNVAYHVPTGLLDFAVHTAYDPANLIGKGAGAIRQAAKLAPIAKGTDIANAPGAKVYKRAATIVSAQTKSWNAHQFYVGVDGLAESTNGMAVASALSKANKLEPGERVAQMNLVQRLAYGDQSAKVELAQRNSEIMDQLAAAEKKTNDLLEANKWEDVGNGRQRYWDKPDLQQVYAQRMANVKNGEAVLASEQERLDALHDVYGSIRDRTLRVTSGSRSKAANYGAGTFGAAAQSIARNDVARYGENPWKVGTIRHSLWNLPVKVVSAPFRLADSMTTMAPQGYVHLHDQQAANQFAAMFHGVRDFDPEKKSQLVSKFIEAGDEGTKQMVIDQAETQLFGHIAKKYGMKREDATKLVHQFQMQRSGWKSRAKAYAGIGTNEAYSSAKSPTTGLSADTFIDESGMVHRVPLLSTQLANSVPVLNTGLVEHVMKRNVNKLQAINAWGEEAGNAFKRTIGKTANRADKLRWGADELANDGLNMFNRIWKFAVLFRLGYPIRNITDEQLRGLAKVDSGMTQLYLEASQNKFRNSVNKYSLNNRRIANAAHRADQDRYDHLDDTVYSLKGNKEAKTANKKEFEELGAKLEAAHKHGLYSVYKPEKHRIGEGTIELPDGSVIADAFGDTDSDLRRALSSGHGVAERQIYQGEANGYSRVTRAGGASGWRDIESHEPGHTEAWLDAVNNQIREDPLAIRVLGGESDAKIIQWLRTDPKGRQLAKRLPYHAANKEDWIANVRSHVESYVPEPEWLPALASGGLKGRDIEQFLAGGGKAPRVNGASLEQSMGHGPVANMQNRFVRTAFKYLSEVPADVLSRHPLYTALYRQRAKEEADFLLADPTRSMNLAKRVDKLDKEDLDHIVKISHDYALKEMKGTLYDISAHSNAAQAMRFMSPFMGAWQEALGRWWGLAKDKPQILNYFNLAWQAPNKMGLVVDREGNPVETSEGITDDEFLVLRMPKWAGGKEFHMFDSVPYIPKSAFNLALQGDPWWLPGFGPLVQIPVGYFEKKSPDMDSVAKFVNPYGPPKDLWDAMSPATVRRVRSLVEGTNAKDYGQDNYRIFNQMVIDWEKGGREGPKPTWKEAETRTNHLYLLKIANNVGNPFPANFRSPYQFYIDGYHILQDQARVEGKNQEWVDDTFMKKYGDTYFVLAQSMSKNNAGLDPTAAAVNAYKKYKSIVDEHPEYLAQIVGSHPGEFNASAYGFELSTQYDPGTSKTMRSLKDPKEAQADNEAKLGWIKYRKLTDGLDAIAGNRGLNSYKEADDLVAMKQVAVAKLMADNQSFAKRYKSASSADTFDLQIPELTELSNDKRLLGDPSRTDIKTLQKYLVVRKIIGQILALRGQQGGAKTPTALANQPLMQIFTMWAHKLAEGDTKFSSNWFNGKLEFDPYMVDLNTADEVNNG